MLFLYSNCEVLPVISDCCPRASTQCSVTPYILWRSPCFSNPSIHYSTISNCHCTYSLLVAVRRYAWNEIWGTLRCLGWEPLKLNCHFLQPFGLWLVKWWWWSFCRSSLTLDYQDAIFIVRTNLQFGRAQARASSGFIFNPLNAKEDTASSLSTFIAITWQSRWSKFQWARIRASFDRTGGPAKWMYLGAALVICLYTSSCSLDCFACQLWKWADLMSVLADIDGLGILIGKWEWV